MTDQILPKSEPQTVEGDCVCVACEYPLKGLNQAGACPECGTRIALSLRDDRLAHGSPLWLFRLSQATMLLCFATLMAWLCSLPLLPPIALSRDAPLYHVLTRITLLIPALAWLGAWVLCTPEYVAAGHYRHRWWCWSIRICATISVLNPWILFPVTTTMPGLRLAGYLMDIATVVLLWLYLRKLARRLPDEPLMAHVPFVLAGLVLTEVLNKVLPSIRYTFRVRLPVIPSQVQSLAILVTSGYAIFILARFSTRFTEATNEAMENFLSEKISDASPSPPPPPPAE